MTGSFSSPLESGGCGAPPWRRPGRLLFMTLVIAIISNLWPAAVEAATTGEASHLQTTIAVGEYGDAPDGWNAGYGAPYDQVIGNFPTSFDTDNSRYGLPGGHAANGGDVWLGQVVSLEEGASDCRDPDLVENFIDDDFDDGLMGSACPLSFSNTSPFDVNLTFDVTLSADASADVRYVNVLIDKDRGGTWNDQAPEVEWVVQDYPLTDLIPGATTSVTVGPFLLSSSPIAAWMRLAVTGEQVADVVDVDLSGWDGSGSFSAGELEDYLLTHYLVFVQRAADASDQADDSRSAVESAHAIAVAHASASATACADADASASVLAAAAASAAASATAAAQTSAAAGASAIAAAAACADAQATANAVAAACASCDCATACVFASASAQASVSACAAAQASAQAEAEAAASAAASAAAAASAVAAAAATGSAQASACADAQATANAAASALGVAVALAQASADSAADAFADVRLAVCGGDAEAAAAAYASASASAAAAASVAAAAYADVAAAASAVAIAAAAATANADASAVAASAASAGAAAATAASSSAGATAAAQTSTEATAESLEEALAAAAAACSELCCPGVAAIFSDGFEAGDLSLWSNSKS